jgi:ATP-binding cassette subfamily F protein uup
LARVSDLAHELEIAGAWQLEAEAKAMLTELGVVDLTARMGTLSGGQRKRVALAHSLLIEPDLLILDEPTNHLDAETVEWLERALADFRGALLLVTHDRYFLDRVTRRMIEIERGGCRSFTGNYAGYLEQKQAQEERQAVEAQKLKQMARRELEWLATRSQRRGRLEGEGPDRPCRGGDPAGAAGGVRPGSVAGRSRLPSNRAGLAARFVAIENLTHGYGERILLRNFSYQFKRG